MKKKENESYLSEVISKLTEHKMAMAGLVVILLEIILVVVLPLALKLNPYDSDYTAFFAAPSSAHIMGTDAIGRDVFARLIYGGRTSLLVGFCSTIISCAIGVPLGLIAGYFRGRRLRQWSGGPHCADSGAGGGYWSVDLVSNAGYRCSGLDAVCPFDLCQCTFCIGKGICGVGKGDWNTEC